MVRVSVIAAAGLVLLMGLTLMVSSQSTQLQAQQPPIRPPQQFPTIGSQGFASPSAAFATRPSELNIGAPSTIQLLRTTYVIPADAAETLSELFDHPATALIECRTDEAESAGLVNFVVTAEPDTQQAVQGFIRTLFPADKILEFQKSEVKLEPKPEKQVSPDA